MTASQKQLVKNVAPLAIVLAAYLLTVSLVGRIALNGTDGQVLNVLDDSYIHMAMAKNLAGHGVYGVTRHAFSSSSSSPLWVLLLAGSFVLAGPLDWLPLLWALVFGAAALWAVDALCREHRCNAVARCIIGMSVLFFAPLVPVAATGMEHTLHITLVLLLLRALTRYLRAKGRPARADIHRVCVLIVLATATRYETLFLAAALGLLILLERKVLHALLVACAAFLPVALYGAVAMAHGNPFLPNTLLLRGAWTAAEPGTGFMSILAAGGFQMLFEGPRVHIVLLLVLLVTSMVASKTRRLEFRLSAAVTAAFLLHLAAADIGWFYRYEAYLMSAGLVVAGIVCLPFLLQRSGSILAWRGTALRAVLVALALLLLYPLAYRGKEGLKKIAPAARRMHQEWYQMGAFLASAYPEGVRIAATDIGAISFYADLDLLDLTGLASADIFALRRQHAVNDESLRRLLRCHRTDLVIVYPEVFRGMPMVRGELRAVADWKLAERPSGARRFTFYATSAEGESALRDRLAAFSSLLPRGVRIESVRMQP